MSTKKKGYLVPEEINPPDELGFCVPVPNDPAYLRAFWGQMNELSRWGMWEKEPSHKAVLAATRWFDSYQRITTCEPCEDCLDDCCVIFTADDARIEYAPNDPFRTPDHVPPGYLLPPWHLDDGRPAANLQSLPIGIFNPIAILSGFPRFKINCRGDGYALLYLRKVANGGYAYITVDGNPAGLFVDMASWSIFDIEGFTDLLAPIVGVITGNENPVEIVEVNLEGSGEHYISVTCLPKLGGLFVLQGFGLQLEKVKICTDEPQEEPEDYMPEFRVVDCVFEWRPNPEADWVFLANLADCDQTGGIGDGTDTPENIDWFCRAAMVVADELMRQAELEVARVLALPETITGLYSYPFEYMIPASVRDDEYFVEGQGDWSSVEPEAYDDWGNMLADPEWREVVRTYLRRIFECLFKNEDHAALDYEWEPIDPGATFAGALDLSASHVLNVPPVGEWDIPNKSKDFADGMFYWFRPYAHAHFDNFINAINYEANLTSKFGVVECLVDDCGSIETGCEDYVYVGTGVSASGNYPGFPPANVLNDGGGRWAAPDEAAGHWVKLDFGSPVNMCSVRVQTALDENPDNFVIEASSDNETWIEIAASNSGAFPRTVNWTPASYRWWRLRILSTGWVSIDWLSWKYLP